METVLSESIAGEAESWIDRSCGSPPRKREKKSISHRFVWPHELHDLFERAVNSLQPDLISPKNILVRLRLLDTNNVVPKHLSLNHLKSHLQRYRQKPHHEDDVDAQDGKNGTFSSFALDFQNTSALYKGKHDMNDSCYVADSPRPSTSTTPFPMSSSQLSNPISPIQSIRVVSSAPPSSQNGVSSFSFDASTVPSLSTTPFLDNPLSNWDAVTAAAASSAVNVPLFDMMMNSFIRNSFADKGSWNMAPSPFNSPFALPAFSYGSSSQTNSLPLTFPPFSETHTRDYRAHPIVGISSEDSLALSRSRVDSSSFRTSSLSNSGSDSMKDSQSMGSSAVSLIPLVAESEVDSLNQGSTSRSLDTSRNRPFKPTNSETQLAEDLVAMHNQTTNFLTKSITPPVPEILADRKLNDAHEHNSKNSNGQSSVPPTQSEFHQRANTHPSSEMHPLNCSVSDPPLLVESLYSNFSSEGSDSVLGSGSSTSGSTPSRLDMFQRGFQLGYHQCLLDLRIQSTGIAGPLTIGVGASGAPGLTLSDPSSYTSSDPFSTLSSSNGYSGSGSGLGSASSMMHRHERHVDEERPDDCSCSSSVSSSSVHDGKEFQAPPNNHSHHHTRNDATFPIHPQSKNKHFDASRHDIVCSTISAVHSRKKRRDRQRMKETVTLTTADDCPSSEEEDCGSAIGGDDRSRVRGEVRQLERKESDADS